MIFVGDDWAEAHHDICIENEAGNVLARRRVPEGLEGINRVHAMVAEHAENPSEVVIGIETDRGLFVQALIATGYQVYAINPFSASRYRDRHASSGAKSDGGDAKMLADLVRTDRHNHRPIAGDTELAESLKVLARAHQNLIWSRQRQVLGLRSTLREFFPAALAAFGEDLDGIDAMEILKRTPTPEAARNLSRSQIEAALRRGGRKRSVADRAADIQRHLRAEHLVATPMIAGAFGAAVAAGVAVIAELNRQIGVLEEKLSGHFEKHPDAEIILSQPGLGTVLGARVLAEFGDDPNRYADVKSRKNYAGMSPITKASGTKRVVLARHARNRRLSDACYWWAFGALIRSPGAREFYDAHRAKGDTHHQALRAVANRLVGILHGCLTYRTLYSEEKAWPSTVPNAA